MISLREFICFNQKELIRFEYTISKLHEEFKEVFKSYELSEEIEEKYSTLVIESFTLLEQIFSKNLSFIKHTYGRYDENIRITIKMVEDDDVIDIFRSHNNENLVFNSSKIKDNTGFDYILNGNDIYYINNDIEKSFIKDDYTNPRLDIMKKEALKNNNISWKDCWVPYKDTLNDYYNSTLIIPMSITIENVEQNSIFKEFFNKKTDATILTDNRIIWGFFCIDSKQQNFFNTIKAFDPVEMGFIITDILSLYLVFFYNYTSGSSIVEQYLKSDEK